MKLLFILLSFFLGNTKNLFQQQSSALTEQIVLNVRALAVILLSSVGALALFCSGFYMLLSHLAFQFDQSGELKITATLIISGLLTLGSLGTLIYCLKADTWLRATGFQQRRVNANGPSASHGGPIEVAVATLIMDFVHQREQSRKAQQSSTSN